MFYYFDTPEIPAVVNGRLQPNDAVLLSDKGLVIIDLDDWDMTLKKWDEFMDIARALRMPYNDWYLIANTDKESCQSICDFAAFMRFTNAIGVFNYVLVPTRWNLIDSFMDNKNSETKFWVQVLDN